MAIRIMLLFLAMLEVVMVAVGVRVYVIILRRSAAGFSHFQTFKLRPEWSLKV